MTDRQHGEPARRGRSPALLGEFAPPQKTFKDWWLIIVTPFTTLVIIGVLIWYVANPPAVGNDFWTLAFLGGFAILLSIASFVVLRLRSFSIRSGVIMLPSPIRLKSGGRTQRVGVEQIACVVPAVVGGRASLSVTLRDGTSFVIADSALPPGAREYLLTLVSSAN